MDWFDKESDARDGETATGVSRSLRPSTLAVLAACQTQERQHSAGNQKAGEKKGFFSLFDVSVDEHGPNGHINGLPPPTEVEVGSFSSSGRVVGSLNIERNEHEHNDAESAPKSASAFCGLIRDGFCCFFLDDDSTHQVKEGTNMSLEDSATQMREEDGDNNNNASTQKQVETRRRTPAAEARALLQYYKVVVIALLLYSAILPIVDTYSDINVCAKWLMSEDAELREYGKVSLGLLFGSLVPMTIFMFKIETNCKRDRRWDPRIGVLLSISFLRMPVSALWDSFEIALKDKVVKKDLEGLPTSGEIVDTRAIGTQKRFVRGLGAIAILRLFEMVCESTLQLLLQSYVVAWRHFKYNEGADLFLIFSIVMSLLTLAFGLVSLYASQSNLVVQILASCFVFLMLVVRFAVHAALFVKLGKYAICFVFLSIGARIAFYAFFTEKNGIDTVKGKSSFMALTVGLTYFTNISTDEKGYFDEIATSGPIRDVAYFSQLFGGRRSRVMLILHCVEAVVGWLFALLLPHLKARAGVSWAFALICGALPLFAALGFFVVATNKDNMYQEQEKEAARLFQQKERRRLKKERRRSERFPVRVQI